MFVLALIFLIAFPSEASQVKKSARRSVKQFLNKELISETGDHCEQVLTARVVPVL